MKSILQYFINRSFAVNLISAFIILSGIILGTMIKRDIIPPFEYNMIRVSAQLPGASATEVEKFLAYPIENALIGLPHAERIKTNAESGSVNISIMFNVAYDDIQESIEQVQSRINGIRWQLPEQSRDFIVRQQKVDTVFHMAIALENFEETNLEHRQIAKSISDQIRSVPGIIEVFATMNEQNIYVNIDPKKIEKYEISIAEIRNRINQSLSYSPIGKVDFDEKSFTIEVKRPTEAIQTLENLALRSNRNGDIVRLSEVAKVALQVDKIKERRRFNGKPVITLYTQKDIIHDSIALKDRVNKLIEQRNQTLPTPLKITPIFDGPSFIEKQLSTLTYNGLFGMIIVLVILTLFFNFRVALATSFGIPIAYCGTLVMLYMMDISIDLISVVGMILVLGILVDDAIIIAERYIENLEAGMKPKEAALESSRDLMLPVTGTVLTTVFAFSPMILVKSEIAIVFYAIPVVIITSLVMSWLESFFILPNHLFHFIKKPPQQAHESTFYFKVKVVYEKILRGILKLRYLAVVALIAFMAVSVWVARNKIQQSFYFNPDIERLSVKVKFKESPSLAATEVSVAPIETYLMSLPRDIFTNINTTVGSFWQHGREYTGYRYARINLYISKDVTHPQKIKQEYTKIVRKELEKFKTDNVESIEVGREFRGQEEVKKNMVTVDIRGNEDVDFLEMKETAAQELKKLKLDLELVKDKQEFDEKWVFQPDPVKLAQHQIAQQGLTQQLRSLFVPHELMKIRMGGESKWLYTQVERDGPLTKAELGKLSVVNARGLTVPLAELGHWNKKVQLATIHHIDGKRVLTMDLAFDEEKGININVAKDQAKKLASSLGQVFPTYDVSVRDADEAETERRSWAGKVALLCVVLVMFTLALVLGSVTLPFIVGLPIPFGLMGIVWALYLHNMEMGMMSLIGLIGTVGVSVNDSLIMVDQIMKRGRQRGSLSREDIIGGASSRLRAIILTTVTTLGGVIPMAYGIGGESGFTAPLAFSLGWGLFFSTFLTLFALPAFIEIRNDIARLLGKLLKRGKKTKTKDLQWIEDDGHPMAKSNCKQPPVSQSPEATP
ncbi:MAG: efflux RND transporter permease subunit [Bdellovibrionales bacterium]|nr:efflux RND transporter permease subunit [Bdellovibrionales bacterium]